MMKFSIFVDFLKLLAVFGIIWLIFYLFPIIPDKEKFEISVEKEEKIGDLMVEEIIEKDPSFIRISNPYIDSVIYIIENRLIDAMGGTDFNYKIYVVDNQMINAYALPGGYIFIYTGLIDLSDSPEEVAAVIAHEMGHIENRHIISRLIKEVGINVLVSADAGVLGSLAQTATSTVFDRRQEKEADEFSLNTLYKAKINPRIMGTFFRKLKNEYQNVDYQVEILSTHPNINSRIKASFEFEVEKNFEADNFELDWEKVKQHLNLIDELDN